MFILRLTSLFFSYLFHPLMLVTYAFVFLMWIDPFAFGSPSFVDAIGTFDIMAIRVFFSTALLPALAIIMMKFLGMLESFEMDDKQDRIGPYIATGVFYLWIFFNINSNPQLPDGFKIFVLGATIALFCAFFINNFRKISIYTVGMGTILGLILMNWTTIHPMFLLPTFQITILIAGIIGTARLILKSNEASDIYSGYWVGILAQFLGMIILSIF